MLNFTYEFQIKPNRQQEAQMVSWVDCCKVYNYILAETKAWIESRKDRTSQASPASRIYKGKKDLSERIHECWHCGYRTDRDVAAAQVIM